MPPITRSWCPPLPSCATRTAMILLIPATESSMDLGGAVVESDADQMQGPSMPLKDPAHASDPLAGMAWQGHLWFSPPVHHAPLASQHEPSHPKPEGGSIDRDGFAARGIDGDLVTRDQVAAPVPTSTSNEIWLDRSLHCSSVMSWQNSGLFRATSRAPSISSLLIRLFLSENVVLLDVSWPLLLLLLLVLAEAKTLNHRLQTLVTKPVPEPTEP